MIATEALSIEAIRRSIRTVTVITIVACPVRIVRGR